MNLKILSSNLAALAVLSGVSGQSTFQTHRVPTMYSEGIVYDPTNNRLILSSYISNNLFTLNASDPTQLLTAYARSDYEPSRNCMGLAVDPANSDRVWCAKTNPAMYDQGGVTAYDIPPAADGSAVGVATAGSNYRFPCANSTAGTGCGLANGVILNDGVVYVTDTVGGKVLHVKYGTIEVLSDGEALSSPTKGAGANGVFYDRDTLVVANFGENKIVRVDVATGEASAVTIEGEDEMADDPDGPDGILLLPDGRMMAVSATTAYVLSEVESDSPWSMAKFDEVIDIDQQAVGERAASLAHGPNANEVFVTFIRMGDLTAGTPNEDPSLLGHIMVAPADPSATNEKNTIQWSHADEPLNYLNSLLATFLRLYVV